MFDSLHYSLIRKHITRIEYQSAYALARKCLSIGLDPAKVLTEASRISSPSKKQAYQNALLSLKNR